MWSRPRLCQSAARMRDFANVGSVRPLVPDVTTEVAEEDAWKLLHAVRGEGFANDGRGERLANVIEGKIHCNTACGGKPAVPDLPRHDRRARISPHEELAKRTARLRGGGTSLLTVRIGVDPF
jgi:hypothetical protein